MWENFKKDFKERFLNFETAKGMYLMPAGLIIVYATIYYLQFILQVCGVLLGWYLFSEGLRKVQVNRIKQKVERDKLIDQRVASTPNEPVSYTVGSNL